ncbi:hypothetical protein LFAB_10155 [Lactiplantibacillus fabifermentans T30PCM01]|uniref:Uncharacterized protein n=1 Tax=Lactiplantibacillus fabifermentans T30PCM01 TaxID=1400520 RepID=W6T6U9_9LACO|nr:hypothetical protein [Lactiplantibacillus fabifermentans]ETY73874.1 hypothetical protein LFAB_10155 [Lactiplantibacillus fabifermentans T30PCM01]
MSNLRTTEIIMSAADYDAISNPKNPKNKAAMVRAQKNFSKLSKTSNINIVKSESKKLSLRKRLEILNGTSR